MRLSGTAAALLVAACVARAQLAPDAGGAATQAPPPPPLKLEGLITLEVPGSALRFGIDPGSISVGSDQVVRYVVIARSTSGVVNAMYEGIRCQSGEYMLYARHNGSGGWSVLGEPSWRPLQDQRYSRHGLIIARSGICNGRGANGSAEQIVRDLRSPVDTRFRSEAFR